MACTIQARDVRKESPAGADGAPIVRGCSLDLSGGGMTAIVGPSGAGKTSLLYCLSGLDEPDGGNVIFDGIDLYSLNDEKRSRLMRERVGFVFQQYNLVPYLNVEENVTLPLALAGCKADRTELPTLLMRFGLAGKRHALAESLSGGEQQRCALCRAILAHPEVVFADEPTGALDTVNAKVVLDVLRELANGPTTVVMVTHNVDAASRADRVIFMRDGAINGIAGSLHPDQILKGMSQASAPRGTNVMGEAVSHA